MLYRIVEVMNMPVVKTNGLTKRYRETTAVDKLNLTLRRGEIYGFLGRNGAGKTTTIRMLLSLITPTAGTASIFGRELNKNSNRSILTRVGAMVENPGFYGSLTARENLELHRTLVGVAEPQAVDSALELVGLSGVQDRRVAALSTGMKQRLGVARALVHDPELLILDEPTSGMDPAGRRELRRILKRLAEDRGTTVFLSSHVLGEVQQVATRIGFLHEGVLVDELSPAELEDRTRRHLDIRVDDAETAAWLLETELQLNDYQVLPGNRLKVFAALDRSAEVNRALVSNGIEVWSLAASQDTLEDYFIELTGGEREC
jgi:bacitracin transport system ATP-binding protein